MDFYFKNPPFMPYGPGKSMMPYFLSDLMEQEKITRLKADFEKGRRRFHVDPVRVRLRLSPGPNPS